MADVNIGQIAASTMQNYRPTMADNIFKERALMSHLMSHNGIEKKDGGREIVVPLMYGTNDTVQAFSGTDTLNTDYQSGIDAAVYQWRYYNVSIVFTLEDKQKNKGKSQVLSLVKSKIIQAENSLKERFADDMFDGAASNSKEITGLETIAAATGTVGNINGATHSWWQAQVDSDAEALSIADVRTIKNSAGNGAGGKKVSIIVTTQTLYEKLASLYTANLQTQVVSKERQRLLDAGFVSLELDGVPVVYDESCTASAVYCLNPSNYRIVADKDYWFAKEEGGKPTNQHVYVEHMVTACNAVTDRRASLGVLTGKTA